MKKMDLFGQKFGKLKVLYEKKERVRGNVKWVCKCECGNMVDVFSGNLIKGKTVSCGCYNITRRRHAYGSSAFNQLFDVYRRNARKRKLDFLLTKNDFLSITKQNCFYCGVPPSNVTRYKECYGQYVYNGIDRKNNDMGYVLDNCVSCCKKCNRAKWDMSLDELIAWIELVHINMKKAGNIK